VLSISCLCRCFYLMASSFAEKQQWVALLEAVASSNTNSKQMADASVIGNVIYRMTSRDDRNMDIMCTWPLSDNVGISEASLIIFLLQFLLQRACTHCRLFYLSMTFCCVRFSLFSTRLSDCLGRTFVKWPDFMLVYVNFVSHSIKEREKREM